MEGNGLTKEELEYLKSLFTADKPICWWCAHCPTRRQKTWCGVNVPWREAVKAKRCFRFEPDPKKIPLSRREEREPDARSQLELVFE